MRTSLLLGLIFRRIHFHTKLLFGLKDLFWIDKKLYLYTTLFQYIDAF